MISHCCNGTSSVYVRCLLVGIRQVLIENRLFLVAEQNRAFLSFPLRFMVKRLESPRFVAEHVGFSFDVAGFHTAQFAWTQSGKCLKSDHRGVARGKAESVLTVLRARFIRVPKAVEKAILAMTDSIALESWAAHAATCQSMDEFAEALK